ncbi:MAG: BREX system ATP-binding domain-containing protein [Cyanobacteriota bacterium]|jgi:GTPase SAR1 family protein
MHITQYDLNFLSQGCPPENDEILSLMTVGREVWLDFFKKYQLEYFIANGGSKVKVLVGDQGTGKTHLIRSVLLDAKQENYETVYLSAEEYKLNNLVDFYQEILDQIDLESLVRDICCVVAQTFGFNKDQYDGSEVFIPKIRDEYPNSQIAGKELQIRVAKIVRRYEFTASFQAFIYQVTYSRMISNSLNNIELSKKWLSGTFDITKEEKKDFKSLLLFEKLQKFNARDWINSLIQLLKLSGKKGLIVAVDDLDVLTRKNLTTGKFFYSKNAVTDVYEIIRQLIDDTEILESCLFIFAGRRSIIDDYNRGFRSYDALWIRLQTGLVDGEKFNPLADLVDVNKHLQTQQEDSKFLVSVQRVTKQ